MFSALALATSLFLGQTAQVTYTSPQAATNIQVMSCYPVDAGVTCSLAACGISSGTTAPDCRSVATTVPTATFLAATGSQMVNTLLALWHSAAGY